MHKLCGWTNEYNLKYLYVKYILVNFWKMWSPQSGKSDLSSHPCTIIEKTFSLFPVPTKKKISTHKSPNEAIIFI